jgi:hypothetical protein
VPLTTLELKKENPLTGEWFLTLNGSKKLNTPTGVDWNKYENTRANA